MKKLIILVTIALLFCIPSVWSQLYRIQKVLNENSDVNIGTRYNGQVLVYNATTNNWENSSSISLPDSITADKGIFGIVASDSIVLGKSGGDILLRRSAANILTLQDNFVIIDGMYINGGDSIIIEKVVAGLISVDSIMLGEMGSDILLRRLLANTLLIEDKIVSMSDSFVISQEALVQNPTEADTSSWAFVGGKAEIYNAYGNNGTFGMSADAVDQMAFLNASAGYSFDDDILARGDTTIFSAESIISNPTEADSSTVKIYYVSGSTGDPIVAFFDSAGGAGNINFTSDMFKFNGSNITIGQNLIITGDATIGTADIDTVSSIDGRIAVNDSMNVTGVLTVPTIKTDVSGGVLSLEDSVDITGIITVSTIKTAISGTYLSLDDSASVTSVLFTPIIKTLTSGGVLSLDDSIDVTGVITVPTIKTAVSGTQLALADSVDITGALAVSSTITGTSIATPTSGGVLSIPDSINVTGVLTVPTIKTATAGTQLALGDSVDITGALTVSGTIDGADIVNTTIGAGGASTGAFTTLSAVDSLNFGTKTFISCTDSVKATQGTYRFLYATRSGTYTNGFGYGALYNNTGYYSNGFGYEALYYNTGIYTNGFGYGALYNNTGSYSNGFGFGALQNNTGSSSNGFGHSALQNNTGSSSNGFGHSALYNNTGSYSNGFGHGALYNNSGIYSNGFGYGALYNNTGTYSNGFGHEALYYNTGSSSNGFGNSALYYNTGYYSNGFGYGALWYNSGNNNTSVGSESFNTFNENSGSAKTFGYTNVNPEGSDTLTITSHGFGSAGVCVNLKYTQGTSAITGLTDGAYNQFKVVNDSTLCGRSTAITAAGTGTGHTMTPQHVYTNSTAFGYNAEPTASNQIVLGDANVIDLKTAGKFITSLGVKNNTSGAGSDSSLVVDFSSGCPRTNYYASDGDAWYTSINTGDQAEFVGASGGYSFDATIKGSSGITATSIATPTDGGVFSMPDSVDISGALTVTGTSTLTGNLSVTGDAILGTADIDTISSSDGVLIINDSTNVANIITFTDDIIALGDTTIFSAEALVQNPTEADTNTIMIVPPKLIFFDAVGGTAYMTIETDTLKVSDNSGGIIFEDYPIILRDYTNDSNSPLFRFIANDGGIEEESTLQLLQGDDPYLRISVDNDNSSPVLTAVIDIHDQVIAFTNDNTTDIGASGANRPKNIYAAGTITGVTLTGAIDSSNVATGSLSWSDLVANANAIDSLLVKDASLSWSDLATNANAIDSSKVKDGALSWSDLAINANAIDSTKVKDGAISWSDLAINANAIDSTKVKDGSLADGDLEQDYLKASLYDDSLNTYISTYGKTFIDDANEATLKATINAEAGVDFQAYDSMLQQVANDSAFTFNLGTNWDITDSTYSGITDVLQAGEALTFGQIVYSHSSGKMYTAQADSEASCGGTAIALGTIGTNAYGLFLRIGYIRASAWTTVGTNGAAVYIDDDTAGLATITAPPDVGDAVFCVGECKGTDILYFSPPPKIYYVVR